MPLDPSTPLQAGTAPDTFGAGVGSPIVQNPNDGLLYQLGFTNAHPPAVIWIPLATWARAKSKWATWQAGKQQLGPNGSWGAAKAVGGS